MKLTDARTGILLLLALHLLIRLHLQAPRYHHTSVTYTQARLYHKSKHSQRIKLLLRHEIIIELLHLGRTNNSVDGSERRSQGSSHHECLPLPPESACCAFAQPLAPARIAESRTLSAQMTRQVPALPALWALVFQFGGNFCSDRNGETWWVGGVTLVQDRKRLVLPYRHRSYSTVWIEARETVSNITHEMIIDL